MVEKVVFERKVLKYLSDLAFKLHSRDYFSYVEDAEKYVDDIYFSINTEIFKAKHNHTPYQHKKFGTYYIIIKTNKRTAWHVYFDKKDGVYLIKKIENNHLPSAKFLNEL